MEIVLLIIAAVVGGFFYMDRVTKKRIKEFNSLPPERKAEIQANMLRHDYDKLPWQEKSVVSDVQQQVMAALIESRSSVRIWVPSDGIRGVNLWAQKNGIDAHWVKEGRTNRRTGKPDQQVLISGLRSLSRNDPSWRT